MAIINDNYLKLKAGYLFPEIGRRVKAFAQAHPEARIIRLGIGDVTEPLAEAVRAAMHKAVDEMGSHETFRGYGPEQGYEFLRQKIAQHDYAARGCAIEPDEIFVSDGSKCDTGNILDILSPAGPSQNVIAVTDPVYPVYVDTNVMAGHTGPANEQGEYAGLVYLPCTAANGFVPPLPAGHVDVIYLCFPNNPTGAVADRATMARWVQYAREHQALILFDAAYEAFITDPAIPHSIYEIPGAREVAIEFRSFSKTAGFTGLRCGFTVVPKTLTARRAGQTKEVGGKDSAGSVDLHRLWLRRQTTKFNGVSYVVQRAAEAVYSPQGQAQVRQVIDFYMENARLIRQALSGLGLQTYGGVNAPYVWLATPGGIKSWEFFDTLLCSAHVVGTPGSGFGAAGEGYFRISAFNSRANVEEALQRVHDTLQV